MLIQSIDGGTRKRLVQAKTLAMRSGSRAGIDCLLKTASNSESGNVALLLQRCEILFLDQQYDVAAKFYDAEIEPLLDHVAPEASALIADNRSAITQFGLAVDRFYHEFDVRRLLGVELFDSDAALQADEDAAAGRHHEALPARWKLLLDAYRSQNWRAQMWAHGYMARECMALGWHDEAAWHAVQARDGALVEQSAQGLNCGRDKRRISNAIERLLGYSKLAQHAALTAKFLKEISDLIPDADVERVVGWASEWLSHNPTTFVGLPLFEGVWKLVGKLGWRVNSDLALQLAQKAANHELIERPTIAREHLINAWRHLLGKIEKERIDQFVGHVVKLITTQKSDFDFVDSVNLACNVGESNARCRDALRMAVFPPGATISNPILLTAAFFLGWRPQHIDKLNLNALEIAASLRKQVEYLKVEEEPSKIGGVMQISKPFGAGKVVVHVDGAVYWVEAMAAQIEFLNDDAVRCLVEAILDMAADDRNIVSNRISLIQLLEKFIPRLTNDLANAASNLIGRVVSGDFKESDIGQTHQESSNPLNPFKIGCGDPRQLRGIALVTLAKGSKTHSAWSEKLHSGLLQDFLEIEDDELRLFGVVAARNADRLSEGETAAFIASALDGTSKVRMHVLHGLASVKSLAFEEHTLPLVVRAIMRAADVTSADERAAAAKAAKSLLARSEISHGIKNRLNSVLERLHSDVSCAVRTFAAVAANDAGI